MMSAQLNDFVCKNCGNTLDVTNAHNGIIECKYCHSIFTLPKENASNNTKTLLQIANNQLDLCEFDKAYDSFNKVLEEDNTEPEAYFGMALATHKIQYLKDEVNNRLQPICHEINNKKMSDDINYLKATLYATENQKKIYLEKASEIDTIQQEFYQLKESGLAYDCFICVKVSDENQQNKTEDYQFADELYYELKGKGYRPFLSERELRNATGADYEARILYALYESECMLIVCSKEEYLRTKWVKNEYSRFLQMINEDTKDTDSIVIIYNREVIEKIPGRNQKLQGIDRSHTLSCLDKIVQYVESHTPESKKRKEEQKQKELEKNKEQENATKKMQEQISELSNAQKQIIINSHSSKPMYDEGKFNIKGSSLIKYIGHDTVVKIPDFIETIEKSAFENADVTSVELPKSLIYIEENAFRKSKLESIIIPSSVKEIGDEAFSKCEYLPSIVIPSSVTSIGDSVFRDCSTLTIYCEVTSKPRDWDKICNYGHNPVYFEINKNNFLEQNGIIYVIIDNKAVVTGHTNKLKNDVVIPSQITINGKQYDVTSIGIRAFVNCYCLESIVIPSSVTSIRYEVFDDCYSLTIYCAALSKPEGWDNDWNPDNQAVYWGINDNNYLEQAGIHYLIIEGKAVISKYTSQLGNDVVIPSTITINGKQYDVAVIDKKAFRDCTSITNIVIPSSVTSIGEYAFCNCESLQTINFESNSKLSSIGSHAFYNCDSLKSIVIPSSVTSIGESAFSNCKSLKIVNFESNSKLTSIGKTVFNDCSSLANIVIPSSVTSIGESAFSNCKSLKIVNFESNSKLTSIGKTVFNVCSSLANIVIPSSVTSIGESAFSNCFSLQTINFESNSKLSSIGSHAFYNCDSLKSIVIPSSVSKIGYDIFSLCPSSLIVKLERKKPFLGLTPSNWDKQWYGSHKSQLIWDYKNEK